MKCVELFTDHFGTICIGYPIDTRVQDTTDRNIEHEVYQHEESLPSIAPQSSQKFLSKDPIPLNLHSECEWHSSLSEEQTGSDILIGQGDKE